jgi:hypothetical protein
MFEDPAILRFDPSVRIFEPGEEFRRVPLGPDPPRILLRSRSVKPFARFLAFIEPLPPSFLEIAAGEFLDGVSHRPSRLAFDLEGRIPIGERLEIGLQTSLFRTRF